MTMTLEECKKIHKDMWEFINNHMDNYINNYDSMNSIRSRFNLKVNYCYLNNYNLTHNCALCQYALEQCIKNNSNIKELCNYCPAIWGSENSMLDTFCESANFNWMFSDIKDIINIQFKE